VEPGLSDFLFLDELARKMLHENPHSRSNCDQFHHDIYLEQASREAAAGNGSFITDRGTADSFAFHPVTVTMETIGTTLEHEYKRYSAVIQMGSSATLGSKHYVSDNIRNETIEEALRIEHALRKVWGQHPNYRFVAADVDFDRKYAAFRQLVLQYIELDSKINNSSKDTSNIIENNEKGTKKI